MLAFVCLLIILLLTLCLFCILLCVLLSGCVLGCFVGVRLFGFVDCLCCFLMYWFMIGKRLWALFGVLI